MTPILELPREAIAHPKRIHLAAVAHLMLWPTDGTMRHRAMKVWLIEEGKRLISEGVLSPEEILELFEVAKSTESRQDLAEERFFVEGIAVGLILFRALAHADIDGDHGSISSTVEVLSQRLWRKHRLQGRTFHNKVLPRLRCVSHLWAAHVAARLSGHKDFPCRQSHLPAFLALADRYRQQGEATRTPHSPRPFLIPGETVAIPHRDSLPDVGELKFAPIA